MFRKEIEVTPNLPLLSDKIHHDHLKKSTMKIHLVGGFLGSGKTTAITNATKILIEKGIATSIITNDQGKYLVDSKFIQSQGIPNAEVTGGCFCCNYDQLTLQINRLKDRENPSVIFAESVGSCTDLIATVLKPLQEYEQNLIEQVTFSTLTDGPLLLSWLQGQTLPFDADTNYIWEKQIEESDILVVNKIDLLSDGAIKFIGENIKAQFPSKLLFFQNAHDIRSIQKWIQTLNSPRTVKHKTVDVDYNKYGKGEANLAWLDESLEFISTDHSALRIADEFIAGLVKDITSKKLPVGHLKFLLYSNNKSNKFSYTTIQGEARSEIDPGEESNRVLLVLNARIQTSPDTLRDMVSDRVEHLRSNHEVEIIENNIAFFRPGFPKPTHRMA